MCFNVFVFLYLKEAEQTYYRNYGRTRKCIHHVCTHMYWDVSIAIVICLNVVCMSLEHYQMSEVRVKGWGWGGEGRGSASCCKPLSQSCAVAKSLFYHPVQTAGRTTKVSTFLYSHNCTLANGAVLHSVCQV